MRTCCGDLWPSQWQIVHYDYALYRTPLYHVYFKKTFIHVPTWNILVYILKLTKKYDKKLQKNVHNMYHINRQKNRVITHYITSCFSSSCCCCCCWHLLCPWRTWRPRPASWRPWGSAGRARPAWWARTRRRCPGRGATGRRSRRSPASRRNRRGSSSRETRGQCPCRNIWKSENKNVKNAFTSPNACSNRVHFILVTFKTTGSV